ncbi:MAG: barstar family protein [Thiobacillus sp.]|nr:barstar family protein [Thiobacillus sp.]
MSLSVARILADSSLNDVYRLEIPSDLLPTLDGRVLEGKAGLLAALGWALEFPGYYGANWDALEECLNDMSWREGPIALHIDHADALDPELLHNLMDIYTDAADAWRDQGRPCSLFLSGLKTSDLPLAG